MKKNSIILLLVLSVLAGCGHKGQLPRGIASDEQKAHFDQVFDEINGLSVCDLHSLMVVQDGKVIYEKYGIGHDADELHICWSATKTFTALAVGFAVQDGLIDLDRPIVQYFTPAELPDSISEQLGMLTMRHLLTMTSGWEPDNITDQIRGKEDFDAVKLILAHGFFFTPGTHWRYNNADTFIAGVIVNKVTGMAMEDYLNEKLFRPLRIKDYYYEKDSRGYNTAAWGLYLTTESLAKAGLFMLQRGEWEGKQLLDASWFDQAMSVQVMQYYSVNGVAGDWSSGYGYQMWACKKGNAFRMDGMWGQYVIVMPTKNAVAVMTSMVNDRENQMDIFWKNVYEQL